MPCASFVLFVRNQKKAVKAVAWPMYYVDVISAVRQNEFDGLCGSERGWSFERVLNARIDGFDDKTVEGVDDRAECAMKW